MILRLPFILSTLEQLIPRTPGGRFMSVQNLPSDADHSTFVSVSWVALIEFDLHPFWRCIDIQTWIEAGTPERILGKKRVLCVCTDSDCQPWATETNPNTDSSESKGVERSCAVLLV